MKTSVLVVWLFANTRPVFSLAWKGPVPTLVSEAQSLMAMEFTPRPTEAPTVLELFRRQAGAENLCGYVNGNQSMIS